MTWAGSWGPEDFALDKETEDNELWDRVDEVFADAEFMRVVDVRELIEPGKNLGKAFDLISWPQVDIINEWNAIEGL